MKIANVVAGTVCIIISIWFYFALSTFSIEKGSDPKRIIIKEGIVRSTEEVAEKLAKDNGFDLDGAYKTGYTPRDVVDYLIKEPHDFPVSFFEGRYYEGRKTVLYYIPLLGCIAVAIIGMLFIVPKPKFRK